ncbi:MAG TPA: alpha/beta hydrolase, partial [Allocoleopsis sp.]
MNIDWWQQHFPKGQQQIEIEDANGRTVSIAYGEVGTGQPLLLLHGLGSWSYNWRHNIQPLSQHFRVICVDAKGYGFSDGAALPETVGHQVIELTQMIQALCDRPVLIAAESLGALTALAVTQAHPHLIDRLVVINVPIFPQQLPSWGMRSIAYLPLELVQWVDQQQLIRFVAPIVQQMTRWVRQEVVIDPSLISDEEIYWLTYPYLARTGTLTQFAVDLQLAALEINRLQANQPNWISHIQQALPHITCPTLVMWSDCDRWFPIQDGERLHQSLPNSRFQRIPDCGH